MDIYDREVARLTANPDAIYESWNNFEPLFGFCGRDRTRSHFKYGCLTQVKGGAFMAEDLELTQKIRSDTRLPKNEVSIRPEHLPVFAEYQRYMDVLFNRTPPEK